MLLKIVTAGGENKSAKVAAKMLKLLGEIDISPRHVARLTEEIGEGLQERRDEKTQAYRQRNFGGAAHHEAEATLPPPPKLACVEIDGGRIRTRAEDQGHGVFDHAWKETKNACLMRMESDTFEEDPQPELPRCFSDQAYVQVLVDGVKNLQSQQKSREEEKACKKRSASARREEARWRPKRVFRTVLSSMACSEDFGPMVAAEAHARRFHEAERRAYVGDGQAYNWKIHKKHFRGFVPIVDFIKVVSYVYAAAMAIRAGVAERWTTYLQWITACWQGRADEVIACLEQHAAQLGLPPKGEKLPADDPRVVVYKTLTYLRGNRSRMRYPQYRRQGLPVTSTLVESLIKEINYRVKGTEKFWNRPSGAEAILQVRAALLSEDDRLSQWIANRPISPYRRPQRPTLATVT